MFLVSGLCSPALKLIAPTPNTAATTRMKIPITDLAVGEFDLGRERCLSTAVEDQADAGRQRGGSVSVARRSQSAWRVRGLPQPSMFR